MRRTKQTLYVWQLARQRHLMRMAPEKYRHEGHLQPRARPVGEVEGWRGILSTTTYERYQGEEPPQWDAQRWLQCARRRRDEREARAAAGTDMGGGPLAWVLVEDGRVPADAIHGGVADGRPLYVCRAFHPHFGSITIQPGRVSQDGQAVIGFADTEHTPVVYEVLVGDERAVQWVEYSGAFDHDKRLGPRPIEAGVDRGLLPLYIAQVDYDGDVLPGKCCARLHDCTPSQAALYSSGADIGAWIPWAGKELPILSPDSYRVLCYTPESDVWGTTGQLAPPTVDQSERAEGS